MDPIVVEFGVACTPEHAFTMWALKAAMWWPRSHTKSQDPDLDLVFEPRPGGRIYERDSDGFEYEWGEVRVWEPPHRIEYWWHLFFDRAEATEITVTFTPVEGETRVRLVQKGFDRLPSDVGLTRRNRTELAWGEVTSYYRASADDQDP